jgi:hypothetical protein
MHDVMTSKIADLDKVEKMAMSVLGAKGQPCLCRMRP